MFLGPQLKFHSSRVLIHVKKWKYEISNFNLSKFRLLTGRTFLKSKKYDFEITVCKVAPKIGISIIPWISASIIGKNWSRYVRYRDFYHSPRQTAIFSFSEINRNFSEFPRKTAFFKTISAINREISNYIIRYFI